MRDMKFKHHASACGSREGIIDLLYQYYMGKADGSNDSIRECFSLLEEYTKGMPYEQSERICSVVCSACAECERIAFSDGITIGAQFILELTNG